MRVRVVIAQGVKCCTTTYFAGCNAFCCCVLCVALLLTMCDSPEASKVLC